ncbi:amidophosphoribosyltransferase [Actinomadura rudentiformis]|uniref:Amidophosphoribosyltransferase n=1 Tax=Actinomadura rudentiformis TaxID=359158 RepID=A0A6H9YTX9_9ACTN|nr:amidophosphoribosyltransferase [Actinomadura rudentiformis]KAB2346954.1 amidophosphoribosyltransferase [Actinomadura rudentiformis]
MTLREACGVAGAWGGDDPAVLVRSMLIALQHRGQEAAGIAVMDQGRLIKRVGPGTVPEAFPDERLPRGAGSLGHVRYATSGNGREGGQPIIVGDSDGPGRPVAVAHNGTLVEPHASARELGVAVPDELTDTEVMARLLHAAMADGLRSLPTAAREALPELVGAYSMVLSDGERLIGVRDPQGFHPLCLGKLGETWLLASEPAAVRAVGGAPVRDLGPGELLEVSAHGVQSDRLPGAGTRTARCLFEYVYFARTDSEFGGLDVYEARHRAGRALGQDAPPPGDAVVVAAPETARVAADGYAFETGLPIVQGLVRHPGAGRSFITRGQAAREHAIRRKLAAVHAAVAGRNVVLVDDSIVRGTTMSSLVEMLREAGAREVHVRIASPPYRWPCFYGMDTGRRAELLAANVSLDELDARLGCDSLAFLTLDRLLNAVGGDPAEYCNACFTGRYPTDVPVAARETS